MSNRLDVFLTERAPAARAQWLQRLLVPVVQACRFKKLVPVEIRPTGRFGGWSSDLDHAPNGRVVLSSHVSFWTAERIISVYLHECSHRLLWDFEAADHGPEFLCLSATLLLRSASFFKTDSVSTGIGLYDCQDRPEALEHEAAWRGIVLNWALAVAAELAASDMTAEALAPVVCQRWATYVVERQRAAEQTLLSMQLAGQQAQQRAIEIAELLNSRALARGLALVGWFSFFSVGYLIFKRSVL